MNKQRASSVIQMCVYFQEQQKKSDLPNNLNFESHTSTFVQTWKHHEALLLLSNVELLIQTLSPASIIVAHASPGPAPPLKLPNTRTLLLFLLPFACFQLTYCYSPHSWCLAADASQVNPVRCGRFVSPPGIERGSFIVRQMCKNVKHWTSGFMFFR